MAYLVGRGHDSFEIRENARTERGPRSRTLATFRELTPDVLERARERATAPLDADALRRAARRAGAPVIESEAEAAAAKLIRLLAAGAALRPATARLLACELPPVTVAGDAERAAGAWMGASLADRGAALRDLLGLADRLPARRRPAKLEFPRLATRA